MIGVQGMANTRRVLKMDKPRPVKISNLAADQSIEQVLGEMDLVSMKLNESAFDRAVYAHIASLCEKLKIFGSQIESIYKDQLDRCYVSLRNGCRDDRLALQSRYRLLEIIELRAMNWQPNENLINYYQQKLKQIENEESSLEENSGNVSSGYVSSSGIISPPTPPVFPGQFPPQQNTIHNPTILQQPQMMIGPQPNTSPPPPPPPPPLLAPGEIVKSSGKFVVPVRVPGKNQLKDEIIIRNADSGKVMGLKGRRVHMIEELSDTVISFQRVAPGARERLVQITGTNEDNISQARTLIEETIRRNASPIRSDEKRQAMAYDDSCSSVSSHASDDMLQGGSSRIASVEATLESHVDYRYTVTHDNDTIRITGSNLNLVRTAKLILDEYFNGEKPLSNPSGATSFDSKLPTDPAATTSKDLPHLSKEELRPTSSSKANDYFSSDEEEPLEASRNSVVTVLRQPLIPSSSKEMIELVENVNNEEQCGKSIKTRRMLFAKTNEEKGDDAGLPLPPVSDSSYLTTPSTPAVRIVYSREFLLRCAASYLSRRSPWTQATPRQSIPIKKKENDYVDPQKILKTDLRWVGLRTISLAEDDDTTNQT